jgi:hypothetical protein
MDALFDIDELIREIELYLAAVEAFRNEGLEPSWSTER